MSALGALPHPAPPIVWIVLTVGGRDDTLRRAVGSLAPDRVLVVGNGVEPPLSEDERIGVLVLARNVGVPAGRDAGVRETAAPIAAFLDDDALAPNRAGERIRAAFEDDPRLGAVALRIVDEAGRTARRHVPRAGGRGAERPGDVALFLGGACAFRRDAYLDAGGYFTDLFYGHEEVELCWRLVDRGWRIRYLADVEVFHPRTEISRHADGWELTGRNRVWIARRTLPWPVALVHVTVWLALGAVRAPRGESRRRYVRGWRRGWRGDVARRPIRWRTVWRLTLLGRPPIL